MTDAVVTRDALLEALSEAGKASDKQTGGWALFTVADGVLSVVCDDHTTRVKSWVPAQTEAGFERSVCIAVKPLTDMVKSLPSEDVLIVFDGDDVGGTATFTTNETSFAIRYAATTFFPQPDVEALEVVGKIAARHLVEAFDRVAAAASSDTARSLVLQAVSMEPVKGHLRMVATDSFRLHVTESEIPDSTLGSNALIPASSLAVIAGIVGEDDDVTVGVGPNAVEFTTPNAAIRSRLVEGDYVPWQGLLKDPQNAEMRARIETRVFRDAIARAMVAVEQGHGLTVTATPDTNRFSVEVTNRQLETTYQTSFPAVSISGGEITVKINAKYLLQALDANPAAEVDLAIYDPLQAIELRSPEDGGKAYTAVVVVLRS